MRMTIDNLKPECIYCYREVDASGLEGFRCTNKTVNKTTSWCRPKNADKSCSICEYCKPKEEEMSIDECIEIWAHPTQYFPSKREEAVDFAIETMRKYQLIKVGYENRLKADMVAMLTEIQLEIEEESWSLEAYVEDSDTREVDLDDVNRIIQQKIDKYKAESEE